MALNGFLPRTGRRAPHAAGRRAGDSQRLEMLASFEGADLGLFWATDAAGHLTYLSPEGWNRLDRPADGAQSALLEDVFDLDGTGEEGAQRPLRFLLTARNSIIRQPVRLRRDGEPVWWEISGKPHFTDAGEFDGYRGSAKDITQERRERQEAAQLASFDPLTGLANRRSIGEQLERTLANVRASGKSCALLMVDLDRFKHVNDTLGHAAGDALLQQAAARLKQIVGQQGVIGRLGGDEFQIILSGCEDRGLLGKLAEKCVQILSQPFPVGGKRAVIGCSVGIAVAPFDGDQADALCAAADLALYAAKNAGRGVFRFYSADLKLGAHLRREVEENLRDALGGSELAMFYQPIVDLQTNKVACFEALMRWQRPEAGFISPSIFIPVAEETGLIRELGRWGLEQACRDALQWPGEIRVAVNVSAIQFANDELPEVVKGVLDQTGLPAGRLELEITESVFMGDAEVAEAMLRRLKKLGVRLALDDFGTGYSSLSYLRNAPYSKIKIDQGFVRGATEPGNNNKAILQAIVDLARRLNMDTVAEGAEAQDELDLVRVLGASHGQGFIFAEALPQSDVLARLEEGRLQYDPVGPACFRADRIRVIRKVGIIHEDHRYQAFMRNLSRTGARIEGLLGVPVGTQIVLDLGEGQLAVAVVRRSEEAVLGVEFETALVPDGAGGLCTRHRVSPYALQAAGRNVVALDLLRAAARGDVRRGSGAHFQEVDLQHRSWS